MAKAIAGSFVDTKPNHVSELLSHLIKCMNTSTPSSLQLIIKLSMRKYDFMFKNYTWEQLIKRNRGENALPP